MLVLLQDYMPFRDLYVSAFKNEIEFSQLLQQTAAALQTNRYIQVHTHTIHTLYDNISKLCRLEIKTSSSDIQIFFISCKFVL